MLDKDKSGVLEPDEIVMFVKMLKQSEEVDPDMIVQAWDKNANGLVLAPTGYIYLDVGLSSTHCKHCIAGGKRRVH